MSTNRYSRGASHEETRKPSSSKLFQRGHIDPGGSDLPLFANAWRCEVVTASDLSPAELAVMRRTKTSPQISRLLAELAGVGCSGDWD